MKIWSAEQLRTFLVSLTDDRLYAMWTAAGFRRLARDILPQSSPTVTRSP